MSEACSTALAMIFGMLMIAISLAFSVVPWMFGVYFIIKHIVE